MNLQIMNRTLAAMFTATLLVASGSLPATDGGQVPAAGSAAPAKRAERKRWVRPAPVRLQSLRRFAARTKADFANPKESPLQNVYELKLTTTEVKTPHGPEVGVPATFHLLGYNGLACGPTIRVRRGSTLRIHLKNDLKGGEAGPGNVGKGASPSDQAEKPHGLDVTNLHTHGLHVSPADPSDNIFLCRKPQEEKDFVYQIPADHPSGTFWYHPHKHAAVAYQLSNGVAGALIVEGTKNDGIHDLDDIPEIAEAKERIFVFQLYNFRARSDPNDATAVGKDAVGWIDATTIYNVEVDKSRSADIQVPAEDDDTTKTVTFQATAINGQINPDDHDRARRGSAMAADPRRMGPGPQPDDRRRQ